MKPKWKSNNRLVQKNPAYDRTGICVVCGIKSETLIHIKKGRLWMCPECKKATEEDYHD